MARLLLSHLFSKLSSLLKPLLLTQRCMIHCLFLPHYLPLTILCLILLLTLLTRMFSLTSPVQSFNKRMILMVSLPSSHPPIVLKNYVSLLPCLSNFSISVFLTSTFPSCWKSVHIQPVPKKGGRCNPSSYRPLPLPSCLPKASEYTFNTKILRNPSDYNLVYDCHYGHRKEQSTGGLLTFLTDSWSPSLQIPVKLFLLPETYQKLLIESGKILKFLNYPLIDSIPLSVPLS